MTSEAARSTETEGTARRKPTVTAGAVHVIDHPVIRVRVSLLRDAATSALDFRRHLQEAAQLMVFEVTRDFSTEPVEVRTPLASAAGSMHARLIILVPILRAGVGMLDGFLQILPEAKVGHIGIRRNEKTLQPESYYRNFPPGLERAEVVLLDPMLATGNSGVEAVRQLREADARRIRFATLVSCPEGIDHFHSVYPEIPVYTTAIDEKLNEAGYIVPGLGDAGDRYFGTAD